MIIPQIQKVIFQIINLLLLLFSIYYKSISAFNNLNSKRIFTFWEPHNKVPGYLQLCLKTWKKFLPDYTIIILDYSNLSNYLESNIISRILCKDMKLMIQVDAIRVALLKKHGGIWMDMDTIITNSSFLDNLKDINCAMFGNQKEKSQTISFIYASKRSKIIKIWLKKIINRIKYYRFISFLKKYFHNNYLDNIWKKLKKWYYLGNGIIDPMIRSSYAKEFFRLDFEEFHIRPEYIFISKGSKIKKYLSYFFSKGDAKKVLKYSKGIILLHNNWTPKKYKKMSEKEFLYQDILISQLLRILLN